jgi:hypothetical protein
LIVPRTLRLVLTATGDGSGLMAVRAMSLCRSPVVVFPRPIVWTGHGRARHCCQQQRLMLRAVVRSVAQENETAQVLFGLVAFEHREQGLSDVGALALGLAVGVILGHVGVEAVQHDGDVALVTQSVDCRLRLTERALHSPTLPARQTRPGWSCSPTSQARHEHTRHFQLVTECDGRTHQSQHHEKQSREAQAEDGGDTACSAATPR